jgi:bifunctional enzyme CysN/CysC
VATPLDTCRGRDPKGLYARADKGELPDLTGVGAPYEPPPSPDAVVDASAEDVATSAARVLAVLDAR